jgi:hypothetical protein
MATWKDSIANDSDKTVDTMEEGNGLGVTEYGETQNNNESENDTIFDDEYTDSVSENEDMRTDDSKLINHTNGELQYHC